MKKESLQATPYPPATGLPTRISQRKMDRYARISDPLALIGMDKELIDYIIRYCTNYSWPTEAIGLRRVLNLQNPNPDLSFVDDQSKVERLYGLESKRVQALVNLGKDALCEKVALRIYQKHKDKIINLCPRYGKLVRTPWAKQCRYCLLNWH